jgi:N-acyl-phosphatidylethanolamine-hydrolysing phospholipase D
VGHSTCFVTLGGVNIITDPIWSDYASPLQFMGPKRYMKPAVDLNKLDIDIVLLSHTHYDHFDSSTIKRIGNKPLWVVPLGVKEILNQFGITRVVEMDWWQHHIIESTTSAARVEVAFTPTKHWTSRNPFDRNTALWGSFVVMSGDKRFFFGGDTAYHSFFTKLGELFGPIDFAALPIGAYKPRWFMKDNHVNPEEAVQIHRDIKSKQSVAIHWGTFPLSDEDYVEPALELARARDAAGIPKDHFFSMRHGETWNVGTPAASDFATVHAPMYKEYKEYVELKNSEKKSESSKSTRVIGMKAELL